MDTSVNASLAALAQYQAATTAAAAAVAHPQASQQPQPRLLPTNSLLTQAGTMAAATVAAAAQTFPRNYMITTALTAPQTPQISLLSHYANPTPSQTAQSLPQGPSTANSSNSAMDLQTQLYYQQLLTNSTPICTCPLVHACPIHDTSGTASLAAAVHQQQGTAALSNALLNTQLRQFIVPQTSLVQQQPVIPPRHVNNLPNQLTQHYTIQQLHAQQIQVQHQAIAAAALTAATNHNARDNRLKRSATFGSDGRPSSKVRRVISIDESAPSSSQGSSLRYEESPAPSAYSEPRESLCPLCRIRMSNQNPPVPLCPCHNVSTCDLANTFCQSCYISANSARVSEGLYRTLPVIGQINAAHRELLQHRLREHQRQRESHTLFYHRNVYNAPTDIYPRTPMDLLLLSELGSGHSSQPTQQQIHTLHQVLAQNPHMSEPPPVGASLDQIKKNTTILNYTKVPEQEEAERCTVCLCDYETGDQVRALNCSHQFHIDCIDRWLVYNKKCPLCRVELDKPGGFAAIIDFDNGGEVIDPTPAS